MKKLQSFQMQGLYQPEVVIFQIVRNELSTAPDICAGQNKTGGVKVLDYTGFMSKKRIALVISSPSLRQVVAEQLSLHPEHEVVEDAPDLVVSDGVTDHAVPHLILGRASALPVGSAVVALPLRLGAVNDQVRYLLSSRTRLSARSTGPIALGPFMLHPDDSQLVHQDSGQILRLTDKERLFLLTLLDAPGHALDRKTLLDSVWGYADSVETHTLETHLYRLRQKLETCNGQDLIVSGDGLYRLKI